jgi:hypothetical protein
MRLSALQIAMFSVLQCSIIWVSVHALLPHTSSIALFLYFLTYRRMRAIFQSPEPIPCLILVDEHHEQSDKKF